MLNKKNKIIVIGSGISGLASAWFLEQSKKFDVLLLEASTKFGGHANSIEVELDNIKSRVDTGFLVFNHPTYPHLSKFFEHLGVEICDSEMSFAVSKKNKHNLLEWAGNGLQGVFAQKRRLFSPAHWQMVRDILRIKKQASALLQEAERENLSLSEIFERHNYSTSFRENYIYPMAAAVWSAAIKTVHDFPASSFIQFCINHSLFEIKNRPQWKTVQGTSINYINKVIAQLRDARTEHKVVKLEKQDDAFLVHAETPNGQESFTADKVILACHTDQAIPIIKEVASTEQLKLLSKVAYTQNHAYLHTDISHMPRNKKIWSAWNYLSREKNESENGRSPVAVTYWLNRLQKFIPFSQNIFVTLNPCHEISPDNIIKKISYAHPQMTRLTLEAQKELIDQQGNNQLYFAGAWTRYGFHEDGILSAVNVMQHLAVDIPWNIED